MDELWVAEFSPDQNCFHIQTLKEHLLSNWHLVYGRRKIDRWILLHIGGSVEECSKFIEDFKKKYKEKYGLSIYDDTEIRQFSEKRGIYADYSC